MSISSIFIFGGLALLFFSFIVIVITVLKASKKNSNSNSGNMSFFRAVIINKRVFNDPINGDVYYIAFNIDGRMIELKTNITIFNAVSIGYLAEIQYSGDSLISIK